MEVYHNILSRSRDVNRASAHLVTMIELSEFYPELGVDIEQWKSTFNVTHADADADADGGYPEHLCGNALIILEERGADLRRGDFVLLEFDLGYRNDGKVMFNGRQIINLAYSPDEYGNIPEEFQIGEFPPRYWAELISHNNLVTFNVEERLSGLNINNVRLLPRSNGTGTGTNMIVPFNVPGGKTYAIVIDQIVNTNSNIMGLAQDFINQIRNERYFEFYIYDEDILSLPPGYSYEDFLFFGFEW